MLRPTVPLVDPLDSQSAPLDDGETEGRGGTTPESQPAPTRTRRKRTAPTGKTQGRKLHLTDDVHDRLWQYARQKKVSVSAAANELLDKTLPRYEVKRVG